MMAMRRESKAMGAELAELRPKAESLTADVAELESKLQSAEAAAEAGKGHAEQLSETQAQVKQMRCNFAI